MSITGDREAWARHARIVGDMLAAVTRGDVDGYLAHVADDMVYEAPYYPEMAPRRGAEEIGGMVRALSRHFASVSYTVTSEFETVDPDLVIVEVAGDNAVRDSDRRYENHYLMFVRFRDDRVVRWTEYSNPVTFRTAMDL